MFPFCAFRGLLQREVMTEEGSGNRRLEGSSRSVHVNLPKSSMVNSHGSPCLWVSLTTAWRSYSLLAFKFIFQRTWFQVMNPIICVTKQTWPCNQARIQEFQNGGSRSRRGRILRSKVCFDASLHIPYVFVRRVVNNIHILNTACWLKSKYLRIYNENLPKKVPFFFFKRGGARPARRSWIRLWSLNRLLYLEIQFRHTHIISNKSIWKWPFLSKLAPNRLNSFFISKHSASISKQGFPVPKLLSSGSSKWTPAAPCLSYGPAEWTHSFMCLINSSKSTIILWTFMMSDIKHSIFRLI